MRPTHQTEVPRGVPDCLKKRRLLNDNALTPDACRSYGEKFLALDYWEDALEFFLKADYTPGLQQLKELAVAEGDAYLLRRLGPQPPEVWRQAAAQAEKLGKLVFARLAREQARDQEPSREHQEQPEPDDS